MIQQSTSTPPPLPSKRKPGQPKPILLATYLETTFIPATTMSKAYSTAMRRAVCLFCEFAGDRLIGQIDSDMLLAFVKHLCAAGCVKSTADDYQLRIGRLVRHCCEGTISDLRKQPRINLSDVDWDDETLLQVVFKNRYLPEKISFRTVHTKNLYRLALRNLDEFLGRRARLADLTDTNIGGMMAWLVDNGRRAVTANNRRIYLLAFWRWCARKRLVEQFPDVEPIPVPDTMPACWSREELTRLLEACQRQPGLIGDVQASCWWLAIHFFWWDTAERTGATLAMRWEHFDAAAGTMYVPGDVRKTTNKSLYRLKPQTVAAFELIRAPERKLIFAFPFSICTFYTHYTRLLKDAGLPHGRRHKPQKMRRSFAPHLEAAGGNATDALQHSMRSVTINSYLDLRVVKREAPNKLLFDIETPNGNGQQNGEQSEPESTSDGADEADDELPGQQ